MAFLNPVVLSRVLIPSLGLVILALYYLLAKCAYSIQRRPLGFLVRISITLGIFGIFALQVNLMDWLSPGDRHGLYFHYFILIECGGSLVVLFWRLFRERAKSLRKSSGVPFGK